MFYSIVVPVFNRPDHIEKLLTCLTKQTFGNFEVIVVESGSSIKSDKVVASFSETLQTHYIYKGNDGQGFSRNRGMAEAKGDYFVILDSDILMPDDYMENVDKRLKSDYLDAYGGPDKLHPESSAVQTAVNFCMTSFLTTGGTRGGKKSVGTYYPRSFNMGVSREVFEKVGGFNLPFMGEDIEWSARIIDAGYKTGLIENAFVYHERKGTVKGFYDQMFFFGQSRINISQVVSGSFKLTHLIPVVYCLYLLSIAVSPVLSLSWFYLLETPFLIYNLLIFFTATSQHKSLNVGLLSILLVNVLMLAYGLGCIKEYIKLYIRKEKQTYVR